MSRQTESKLPSRHGWPQTCQKYMRLRHLLIRTLITITLVGSLHGADVLDAPVPWAGRISGHTLAELVARMRGWSDIGDAGTFELSTQIPERLATKKLDLVRIPDAPRPTYRELLVSALKDAGQKAEVRRGQEGIEIIYMYARSFRIPSSTRQALDRKGRWSLEGIKSELDDKAWSFSEFVAMRFFAESSTLIVQGTSDDLDKTARFFGQK